jgi:hypothetical protein
MFGNICGARINRMKEARQFKIGQLASFADKWMPVYGEKRGNELLKGQASCQTQYEGVAIHKRPIISGNV